MLKISDPVFLHEGVPCAHTGDNARNGVILRGLAVGLINGVKICSAADGLQRMSMSATMGPKRTHFFLMSLL